MNLVMVSDASQKRSRARRFCEASLIATSYRDVKPVAELDEVALADVVVALEIEGRRGSIIEGVAEGDEVGLVDDMIAVAIAEHAVNQVRRRSVIVADRVDDAIAIAVERAVGRRNLAGQDVQRVLAVGQ